MDRTTPRPATIALLAAACLAAVSCTGTEAPRGTIVIAPGAEPSTPVPTLIASATDQEVAELLFLRLGELDSTGRTLGDSIFRPALARSWSRPDSLTLVFELDPGARWQDGRPVTSSDVAFTFVRSRRVSPSLATALSQVDTVTTDGPERVVFHFRQAYGEQMYDAVWHLLILPEHLVGPIPDDSLAESGFAAAPVGSGPYRFVRRTPGQTLELAANDSFFLGRPGLARVIYRTAGDADARLNLLLSGGADLVQWLGLNAARRVEESPDLRVIPVPSSAVTYVLFNQKASGNRDRPNPILSDVRVRRALLLGLDREAMLRSVYDTFATIPPDAPVPQAFAWVAGPADRHAARDTAQAQALLREAGWVDHDGDGILDRNGRKLELTIDLPGTNQQRRLLAQQMQEQLGRLGVKINIQELDFTVFSQRRNAGQFEMNFGFAVMDPSPTGIRNSWSCATAGRPFQNVGSYCNPAVDSLLALGQRTGEDRYYQQAIGRIQQDVPAIFLAAPFTLYGMSDRFAAHPFRIESQLLHLWQWSTRPGQELPQDSAAGE
ncbi:MAG: ABC transporter substrate-binding protein [Gemmatimonadales bacterium]